MNRILCYCLMLLPVNLLGQVKFIKASNSKLEYGGRYLRNADNSIMCWPGNSVSIFFKGNYCKAILSDSDTADYFNVILDNNVISKIHLSPNKQEYLLADHLSIGKHKIQLFKRTEADKGYCTFYGFSIPPEGILFPPYQSDKRTIEFYGNSITCGYGDEDPKGNDRSGFYENNYVSYAAITSRKFKAHYSCISKSGIGVTVSWFPLIMSEMYDRTLESDAQHKWNFRTITPHIVVVDLFQNDSWIITKPDYPEYLKRFKGIQLTDSFFIKSYKDLITDIRKKYPSAKIICTLGNMDAAKKGSKWIRYIEEAVIQLKDKNLLIHFFPFKNTSGHPTVVEQQQMAMNLIKFIQDKKLWN